MLPDGTRADDVLCGRHGRSFAVIEASFSYKLKAAIRDGHPVPYQVDKENDATVMRGPMGR